MKDMHVRCMPQQSGYTAGPSAVPTGISKPGLGLASSTIVRGPGLHSAGCGLRFSFFVGVFGYAAVFVSWVSVSFVF